MAADNTRFSDTACLLPFFLEHCRQVVGGNDIRELDGRARVPGCRFAFVARLPNHTLCFHKRSKDGSAKCNAFRTAEPTDAVIGAVYEIPTNEKPALDLAEGVGSGYHEEIVQVLSPKGKKVAVRTYIADETFIDDSLCA